MVCASPDILVIEKIKIIKEEAKKMVSDLKMWCSSEKGRTLSEKMNNRRNNQSLRRNSFKLCGKFRVSVKNEIRGLHPYL